MALYCLLSWDPASFQFKDVYGPELHYLFLAVSDVDSKASKFDPKESATTLSYHVSEACHISGCRRLVFW